MNIPVHRHTDSRSCGATTTVIGQSTVYINSLLASVQGDTNTHGGGALSASINDGTIFINGKKVVLRGSSAAPDTLCVPIGPPHCNPESVGASANVFASGGGSGGSHAGSPNSPTPGSEGGGGGGGGSPDPNAQSEESIAAEETAARDAAAAGDPSAPNPANTPPGSQSEAERRAFDYFVSEGYTPAQAAGIVGNLVRESNLNPNAINPNDAGYGRDSIGLAQWNRERLTNLQGFAATQGTNYRDFDTQLKFINHELRGSGANGGGSERSAYNRLVQTNTPGASAVAFTSYERFRGWELGSQSRETQNRAAEATRILGSNV